MEIKYFTQNITLTGELQEFLQEKVQKLGRFSDKIWEARVDLSYNPAHSKEQVFRLEINLRMPNKVLRGVSRAPDLQTAIDIVEKKLRSQLERYKGYGQTKKRQIQKTAINRKTV